MLSNMLTKASSSSLTNGLRAAFPRLLLTLFMSGAMRGYSSPYFNLFLSERGFSGTLIGTLLSAAALVELAIIPLLSNFSDRTRAHRLFFRLLLLGYATACMVMLLFPYRAVLFVCVLVTQVNLTSTFVFGMQLAFTKLQQNGKELFGRARSMSAGGFMFANLTGTVILMVGSYATLFTAAAISGLMAMGFSNAMPKNTVDKPVLNSPVKRNRQIYVLLASQFFVTMGIRNGFAFWLVHFQENLGISTWQIAVLITMSAAFEIPWFLMMDTTFKGRRSTTLYTLGVILFGVIWVFIGLVPSFIWIVIVLIPRGLAFAMWNLSALSRINEISHPRNVSTNQALAQITIPGIAALVSGAPMGYVYDHFAPVYFFSICCALLFIGATVMFVGGKLEDGSLRLGFQRRSNKSAV